MIELENKIAATKVKMQQTLDELFSRLDSITECSQDSIDVLSNLYTVYNGISEAVWDLRDFIIESSSSKERLIDLAKSRLGIENIQQLVGQYWGHVVGGHDYQVGKIIEVSEGVDSLVITSKYFDCDDEHAGYPRFYKNHRDSFDFSGSKESCLSWKNADDFEGFINIVDSKKYKTWYSCAQDEFKELFKSAMSSDDENK